MSRAGKAVAVLTGIVMMSATVGVGSAYGAPTVVTAPSAPAATGPVRDAAARR